MNRSSLKTILKSTLLQKRSLSEHYAVAEVYAKSDMKVMSGPFKGMRYVENSTGGAYFPKLLGTYELELSGVINDLKTKAFTSIINVGGGEGYFAVGLARLFPSAHVTVFEPGFYGCHLMEKMAEMNGVKPRLSIKCQLCGTDDLNHSMKEGEKTLVFMDVEGAELILLDPEKVHALKKATIVVEIHDTVSPVLGETIKQRFLPTHNVKEIIQQERKRGDLPFAPSLGMLTNSFIKLMNEGRGSKMRWFVMEPL